jgi:hypothetical protein
MLESSFPNASAVFVIGWTGMRGVVALAVAISLSVALRDGSPFPQRNLFIGEVSCWARAVRAELRELESRGSAWTRSTVPGALFPKIRCPAAIVLEATTELVGNPAIYRIRIASRTETVQLPPIAVVLYRPVRIGDIVAKVRELLARAANRLRC